jgi:hypothetical protein
MPVEEDETGLPNQSTGVCPVDDDWLNGEKFQVGEIVVPLVAVIYSPFAVTMTFSGIMESVPQ